MSETPQLGLRERKRRATHRAIQMAVLGLAKERGIEKVTVEDISRVANVSPRTFFNYFASKDAAFVGDTPGIASEADVEAFVTGGPHGDLLTQLATLLAANMQRTEDDHELYQLRREVMKNNAYLFGMRMATLREFEVQLQQIVVRRFLTDEPELADDPQRLDERALLFTLVAAAAIRHAWQCWADGTGTPSLSERVRTSFTDVYAMTRRTG
ncbi:hypothetical protein JF66_13760 [Cryobacterium sp. MLB-32]|uniref:TetR/AcrR family transcriptional regulator n=1 Tax=Cryobacterium sp. MLB-32 TaxID=1529318 RepID=UPI0004E656EF|nr:helix-turn-helix domain-containing protein [Cryobacterium sp. MLB-32]KFF59117.1 hypothetical protein JF66_13760 [Cryobacterium sp. MLB-32]